MSTDYYKSQLSRIRSNSRRMKRFYVGEEPPRRWVLRDSNGDSVSPVFDTILDLFKWCAENGYAMIDKNPLIRKKV